MLQLIVVVLEGGLGVVGRVDKNAFHLPAVERQQRLERQQVVTLDQQVLGICLAMGGLKLQQMIGDCGGGAGGLRLIHPIEKRHLVVLVVSGSTCCESGE